MRKFPVIAVFDSEMRRGAWALWTLVGGCGSGCGCGGAGEERRGGVVWVVGVDWVDWGGGLGL